jgi:hypothetical protein
MNSTANKAVFIFGAGAVLDWGAPLTICRGDTYTKIPEHGTGEIYNRPCCLTHLMLVTGFNTKSGERITQRIFDWLKSKDINSKVNFETILNVIEDLHAYWSARASKEINNIYGLIDIDEELSELHNFTVKINQSPHLYALNVPGFILQDADRVSVNIDPHVKYYELMLNDLLSGIIGHISKYAYPTPPHEQIDRKVNLTIDNNFRYWMRSFIKKGLKIRCYTLNYDDIFKVLLEQEAQEVFDGFYNKSHPNNYHSASDLKRIVTDSTSVCHYNLHGSWSWKVEELNINRLKGYQYIKFIPGLITGSTSTIEIERGKRLLLSNIISGFQKVQKTAISPFRQFFSALDRDCIEAEELYVIGYSYGDEHVNDIIRNAKQHNSNLKITFINPDFDEVKFAEDFLSNWGEMRFGVYEKLVGNAVFSKQFGVLSLKKKFSDFLTAFAANAIEGYW